MPENLSCFVIIGYGKKASYANGELRELDLDETFTLLIKPVFEDLGIDCYRAIDKNLTESIDKVMLKEIKNADIALADLSTLNANVMWELGVRHALKPHHTIMICEKEQMEAPPFDVNHYPIHTYTHSKEGIPFKEVERFRGQLKNVVEGMLAKDPVGIDSPVFDFLGAELTTMVKGVKSMQGEKITDEDSFATVMEKAEGTKKSEDYEKALELFGKAKTFASKNMTLKDNLPHIISRQALCTYKLQKPDEAKALVEAQKILEELRPKQSQDIEVLGLSGGLHKRHFEISGDIEYLDNSIGFYEKGFQMKQDYYNGINAAFMLYLKTSLLKSQNEEWEDVKLNADYTRNSTLQIALKLESDPDFLESGDAIWVLFTIAEAYNYKRNEGKMEEYENRAMKLAKKRNDEFAPGSYKEQKEKIKTIFENI